MQPGMAIGAIARSMLAEWPSPRWTTDDRSWHFSSGRPSPWAISWRNLR